MKQRGFTLIELLVVITIIAVLASMSFPAYNKIQERAKLTKTVNNVRQIILAMRAFAADEDGSFPYQAAGDEGGGGGGGGGEGESDLGDSTSAFNNLIPDYVDTEIIFWTKSRAKPASPVEDGSLTSEEVSFSYVSGQSDTSFSRSPLVMDETEGGTYGEDHPWLASKKAVVGNVSGSVAEMRLNSNEAGATVVSKDKQVEDIFQEREPGGGSGGLREQGTEILDP